MGLRGASTGQTQFDNPLDIPGPTVSAGQYTVTIDFKFDSENSTGKAKCVIDPENGAAFTLANESGIKLGVPFTIGGELYAGYVTMGLYGSTVPVPETQAPRITISRIELYQDREE
jgi:hypothetical protein